MKKMNRALLTALLLSGALSLHPVVRADDTNTGTKPAAEPAAGERGERLRHRLKEVAQQLDLTDEQKEKLKPIFHAEMEKLKELHANTSLSREQKKEKLKSIRNEISPLVEDILTPEQRTKWKQIREELREKAAKRHQAQ